MVNSVGFLKENEREVEVLPLWLMKQMPEIRKCGLLGYDYVEDIFWVKDSNESMSYYQTLKEAVKGDCNLSVHASIEDSHKVVNSCVMSKDNSEMVFVKNDSDKLNKLCVRWNEWRELADKVVSGNASWQDSYKFIETFPLFWKPLEKAPTFVWATNNGHDNITMGLDVSEILLVAEIDSENLAEEDSHVLVSSDSIDTAYVLLAQKLAKLVNLDDCSC